MRLASSMAIVGAGGRHLLEGARGQEARQRGQQQQEGGHDEEAPEDGAARERQGPVGQPGQAVEEEDQRADDERRGGGGDDRALHELADLRGDLGLRQLDLLLDEGLDVGADVAQRGRDGLGAAAVALGQGGGLVLRVGARSGAHRVSRFRTRAATRPPAKAAPARISGRSAGASPEPEAAPSDGVPHRGRLGGGRLGRRGDDSGVGPAVVGAWGSSLTRAGLPRRPGGKPGRPRGSSRSRRAPRCRPGGPTRRAAW